MERGEITRLMLFLPPRHGKSEMVTVRYPVWKLTRDPSARILIGAYNQTLAEKFSLKARRIAQYSGVEISRERHSVEDWETMSGGGLRAAGVGAGVTGMGANLVIVDDPVKNREEAQSPAYRDRVWDWYTNDLYTRLEPNGSIILIMTRWHEDDLAGRIQASEDGKSWKIINLPAEAEEGDPLGRAVGQPLCPARFDLEALAGIKRVLGRDYHALYQQRPRPREGEMFKLSWFEIIEAWPAGASLLRYWDKAGTAGGGKFTAGVLMAYSSGVFIVVDVVRGQWAAAEREKVIRQTAILDREKYDHVTIWTEQEPGSGGKESAEGTIRNLAGFVIYADRPTGDKVLRAEPFSVQAEAGNVKLLRGEWNTSYLGELTSFPSGTFADQVDGSSGAFNKLVVYSPYGGIHA